MVWSTGVENIIAITMVVFSIEDYESTCSEGGERLLSIYNVLSASLAPFVHSSS